MQYVLTQNKQILLGPIFWRHRQIQSELEDQEVEYQVAPTEPNAYVKINDEFEIFPVTGLAIPNHDPMYQQLAGPFWTFTDVANGTYNIVDKQLDVVKNDLKALTAAERYKKENAGTKTTVQDVEVSVATDRASRSNFAQAVVAMTETETVQWKFPESWITLTYADTQSVLRVASAYVQTQFDWEKTIIDQITTANTAEELKQIVIVESGTLNA